MTHISKQNETYKLLVMQMFSRCLQIQAENERSIKRVNSIKKILRERTYDVELLKVRLEKHGDNWRSVSMATQQTREQKRRGPKPKTKPCVIDLSADDKQAIVRKPQKQREKHKTDVGASSHRDRTLIK